MAIKHLDIPCSVFIIGHLLSSVATCLFFYKKALYPLSIFTQNKHLNDAAKEATEQANMEKNKAVVIKGWLKGYPVDELSELTDLSIPEVEYIIKQYKSVQ